MSEQVSNIYLNGEPMVWITIEPNTDGDLELGLGDSVSGEGLYPLSKYNRHKECGTIPYEWWTGLSYVAYRLISEIEENMREKDYE